MVTPTAFTPSQVGSTTQSGRKPWYLEECSSTLATTYSSGYSRSLGVVTTDLRQRCTDKHSGTSASAPMAAGIIALTLAANPALTWRDVQHIVVKTSRRGHLSASDWQSNGAGYDVSHLYGFGLMDAEAMVKEAETWKQVPPQHVCEENVVQTDRNISPERVLSWLDEGRCVVSCSDGQYPSSGQCHLCDHTCAQCVDAGAANCTSCDADRFGMDRYLFRDNPKHCLACIGGYYKFEKGCYKHCPSKTYTVEETMSCVSCEHDCVSCDEDECYWCEADLFLSDGNCVRECPNGFNGDEDSQECEECHSDCRTCSGPEDSDCDSCVDGFMLDNGACVPERDVCPAQTFLSACDSSCLTYSGAHDTSCTSCSEDLEIDTHGRCAIPTTCPSHHYSQQDGECHLCHKYCHECSGSRQDQCLSCNQNHYLLSECVLSTNFAFCNHEGEENTGNLTLFITTSILLVFALLAVIILIKRSLSKQPMPEPSVPRRYEKLGHGGGKDSFYRGTSSSTCTYGGQASSSSGQFRESELVDLSDQKGGQDDDDEDEDILYMGQDGTVYRKFRYGQLGDEQEDELEYDDESHNYQ
ncbi:hypothetical protein cypCar_00035523 [Cyprinus carpio]|nr:hypothetical protein cypCar_00035523 [Cyprinus carpio]